MSPAYRFHPEFGYFCPSLGFRRKLRVGLACLVVGGLVGTGGTLAFRTARDHVANRAMTLTGVDEPSPQSRSTSVAGTSVSATSGADQAAPVPAAAKPNSVDADKAACEQDTWAYLDGKCVATTRTRKARNARPLTEGRGIATLPLGRRTSLPAASDAPPVMAAGADRQPPSSPPPAQAAVAGAAEAAATSTPAESIAQPAAPKKAKKVVRRARDRHHDAVARRDARAREAQLRDQRGGNGGTGFFGGPFGFLFR